MPLPVWPPSFIPPTLSPSLNYYLWCLHWSMHLHPVVQLKVTFIHVLQIYLNMLFSQLLFDLFSMSNKFGEKYLVLLLFFAGCTTPEVKCTRYIQILQTTGGPIYSHWISSELFYSISFYSILLLFHTSVHLNSIYLFFSVLFQRLDEWFYHNTTVSMIFW